MFKLGYTATSEGHIPSNSSLFAPGKRLITATNPNSKPISADGMEKYRINSIIFLNRVGNTSSTFTPQFNTLLLNGWSSIPWTILNAEFSPIQNGNLFSMPGVMNGLFPLGQFEVFRQFIRENIRQIWTTSLFTQASAPPNATYAPINKYVNPVSDAGGNFTAVPNTNYGVSTAANLVIDSYPMDNDIYPDEYDYRFWFDATTNLWQGNINGPIVGGVPLALPSSVSTITDNTNNNPRRIQEIVDGGGVTRPNGLTGVRVYSIDILRQRRHSPLFFITDPLFEPPVLLPMPPNSYEINNNVVIDNANIGTYNPVNGLFEIRAFRLNTGECIGNVVVGGGRSNVVVQGGLTVNARDTNRRIINFNIPTGGFWNGITNLGVQNTFLTYPLNQIHGPTINNAPAHEFGHVMGLDDRYAALVYGRSVEGTGNLHLGTVSRDSAQPTNNIPIDMIQNIFRNPLGAAFNRINPGLGNPLNQISNGMPLTSLNLTPTAPVPPNDTYQKWLKNISQLVYNHSPIHWPMYFPGFFSGKELENTSATNFNPNPVNHRTHHDTTFSSYPPNYRPQGELLTPYDIEYSTYFGWHHNIMSNISVPVDLIVLGGGGAFIRNNFHTAINESDTYHYLMYDSFVATPSIMSGVGYSDLAAQQNVTTIFITQVQLDIVLNISPDSGYPMRLNFELNGNMIDVIGNPTNDPQYAYAEREEHDYNTSKCSRDALQPIASSLFRLYIIDNTVGKFQKFNPINWDIFGPRLFWRWTQFINLKLLEDSNNDTNPTIPNYDASNRILNDFDKINDPECSSSFIGIFYQDQDIPSSVSSVVDTRSKGYWPVGDNNYRQVKTTNIINVGVDDVMDFRMSYASNVSGTGNFKWNILKTLPKGSGANNNKINLFKDLRAYKPFQFRYQNEPDFLRAEYGDAIYVLNAIANYIRALMSGLNQPFWQFFNNLNQASGITLYSDYRFGSGTINLRVTPNAVIQNRQAPSQSIDIQNNYYKWDFSKPTSAFGDKFADYTYGSYLRNPSRNGGNWSLPLDGITLDEAEQVILNPTSSVFELTDMLWDNYRSENRARGLWNAEDHVRANFSTVNNLASLITSYHTGINNTSLPYPLADPGNGSGVQNLALFNPAGNSLANAGNFQQYNILDINNLPMFNNLLGASGITGLNWQYTETLPSAGNNNSPTAPVGINGLSLKRTIGVIHQGTNGKVIHEKLGFRLRLPQAAISPITNTLLFPNLGQDIVFDIVLRYYRNRRNLINSL